MNTPESTTHSHSYCKWHMKYDCGISVCCECYPDKCEQNREVKEEDLKKGFTPSHEGPLKLESVEERDHPHALRKKIENILHTVESVMNQ